MTTLSRDLKPTPLATPFMFCAGSAFLFSLYRLGRAIQRLRRDAARPAHPDHRA